MKREKVVIMGAAGRDFHNFNVQFRGRPDIEVVAFTAAQIPDIAGRAYPPALAGPDYPKGIPIVPESELPDLIARDQVDRVELAYSDLAHVEVMHKASIVLAAGASFELAGPRATELVSSKPVVSVCAVRTGSGKSPLTRFVSRYLRAHGKAVAIVRHPMPYGDLEKQAVQRFAAMADLDAAECTIEEREEYEPHLTDGAVVYAGVDYETILRRAEAEADIVLWDGGNNDLPFYRSDLPFVVADPHRAGHELSYHPGEANFRRAEVIVISKTDSAPPEAVRSIEENARRVNPKAVVLRAGLRITADDPERVRGKRVLVVEDGPTVTHGGMPYGAGTIFAKRYGAKILDPRKFAVGSIAQVYQQYPHLTEVLPAMGYGRRQVGELEETVRASRAEFIVDGSPVNLAHLLRVPEPIINVRYEFDDLEGGVAAVLDRFIARSPSAGSAGVPKRDTRVRGKSARRGT